LRLETPKRPIDGAFMDPPNDQFRYYCCAITPASGGSKFHKQVEWTHECEFSDVRASYIYIFYNKRSFNSEINVTDAVSPSSNTMNKQTTAPPAGGGGSLQSLMFASSFFFVFSPCVTESARSAAVGVASGGPSLRSSSSSCSGRSPACRSSSAPRICRPARASSCQLEKKKKKVTNRLVNNWKPKLINFSLQTETPRSNRAATRAETSGVNSSSQLLRKNGRAP